MLNDWACTACTQIQLKVKAMNIFYHSYVLLIFIYWGGERERGKERDRQRQREWVCLFVSQVRVEKCRNAHVEKAKVWGQLAAVGSLLTMWVLVSNSSCWVWRQAPLPTKPSLLSTTVINFKYRLCFWSVPEPLIQGGVSSWNELVQVEDALKFWTSAFCPSSQKKDVSFLPVLHLFTPAPLVTDHALMMKWQLFPDLCLLKMQNKGRRTQLWVFLWREAQEIWVPAAPRDLAVTWIYVIFNSLGLSHRPDKTDANDQVTENNWINVCFLWWLTEAWVLVLEAQCHPEFCLFPGVKHAPWIACFHSWLLLVNFLVRCLDKTSVFAG